MNKIEIFKNVKEFLAENKFDYNVELHLNYIRVGFWERACEKLENHLLSLGFKLCDDYDEDRGVLFDYCLPRKEEVYIILAGDEEIEAEYLEEGLFLGGGVTYKESDVVILYVKSL